MVKASINTITKHVPYITVRIKSVGEREGGQKKLLRLLATECALFCYCKMLLTWYYIKGTRNNKILRRRRRNSVC